jgi:hypothetical protein
VSNIATTIQINSTGSQIDDSVLKKHQHITQNTVFADSTAPDGGNGTLSSPFNNLQQAVDVAPFGANVRLEAGLYTVPNRLLKIENKDNVTLVTDGVKGQYRAVIDADLLITGNSQRIGIKNLQINGKYTYDSTEGMCYIDNMFVRDLVHLVSTGYHRYDDVFFNNMLVQGSVFLDMRTSQCEDNSKWTVDSVNATMSILDCLQAKYEHLNGNMFLDGVTNVLPVGDNVGILSTSNNGVLRIGDLSMIQPNGQYASIQKTGTCPYLLGILAYDPSNSVLNGVAIRKSGIQAEQVYKDGLNMVQVLTDLENKIPKLIEVADESEAITASTADPNNIYFWV